MRMKSAFLALLIATLALDHPAAAQERPVVMFNSRHGITEIAFSADGKLFATASHDSTARLWDRKTGRLLRILAGHTSLVDAVAFSPDGSVLATASDKRIKLWQTSSGRQIREFENQADSESIFYARDGRSIFASGYTKDEKSILPSGTFEIRRFDASSGKPLKKYSLPKGADFDLQIAISADEARVATEACDVWTPEDGCRLMVWDARSRRMAGNWKAHEKEITFVSFTPNSKEIVSASDQESTIKVWAVEKGKLLRAIDTGDEVEAAAMSDDGALIAAVSWTDDTPTRSHISVWSRATGELLWRSEFSIKGGITALAFAPGGNLLAADDGEGRVEFRDAATGKLQPEIAPAPAQSWDASSAPLPDGRILFSDALGLAYWDQTTGELTGRVGQVAGRLSNVAQTPSGQSVVAVKSQDGKNVTMLDTASGQTLRTISPELLADQTISHVALSARAETLGVASWVGIQAWDPGSGRLRQRIDYDDTATHSFEVAPSPDGSWIVSAEGSDHRTRIWNVADGKLIRRISANSYHVAVSPDGRHILTDDQDDRVDSVKLWDAASGNLVRKFAHGGGNFPDVIAFSPDGSLIATVGGLDKQFHIWETTGRKVANIQGNPGNSTSVAFFADNKKLISSNDNGTFAIFDARSGALLATSLRGSNGEWATITPEGYFTASSKGADLLHVVEGTSVTTIDQVFQALYRPDLVREKLAGDPEGKVRQAAAELDLLKVMQSGVAPRVEIVAPSANIDTQADEVTVEAAVADAGGGIGRLEWRLNGVTLGVEERGLARANSSADRAKAIRVSRALLLEPGENVIELSAYNAAGLIASKPATLTLNWNGAVGAARPKLHILAAGVSDYWDSRLRLAFAAADARALAHSLQSAGESLYEAVDVRLLIDSEVTIDGLERAFSELAKTVHPRDVFLFFLAGHGKTVDGRYYFLPQDFRYQGAESITGKGVDQERFQQWFAQVPARKSLLLFDTCESGSLTGEGVTSRGLERVAALDRLTRATGRTVLSAATDDAPALEGVNGHGVFTYVLLDALSRADANVNGTIEITELAGFVDESVPEVSYAAFKLRQVPQMRIVGANFPVASRLEKPVVAGTSDFTPVSSEPTHVIFTQAEIREGPNPDTPILMTLPAGTQVRIMKIEGEVVLVARNGRPIGYAPRSAILELQ